MREIISVAEFSRLEGTKVTSEQPFRQTRFPGLPPFMLSPESLQKNANRVIPVFDARDHVDLQDPSYLDKCIAFCVIKPDGTSELVFHSAAYRTKLPNNQFDDLYNIRPAGGVATEENGPQFHISHLLVSAVNVAAPSEGLVPGKAKKKTAKQPSRKAGTTKKTPVSETQASPSPAPESTTDPRTAWNDRYVDTVQKDKKFCLSAARLERILRTYLDGDVEVMAREGQIVITQIG